MSGHVIRKYQVEGDYIEEAPGLFDVADLSTVWIEAQVYEDEWPSSTRAWPVTPPKAFPNRDFTGKLAFIHPHLDANAHPQGALRPGQSRPRPAAGHVRQGPVHVPATQLTEFADGVAKRQADRVAADFAVHWLSRC